MSHGVDTGTIDENLAPPASRRGQKMQTRMPCASSKSSWRVASNRSQMLNNQNFTTRYSCSPRRLRRRQNKLITNVRTWSPDHVLLISPPRRPAAGKKNRLLRSEQKRHRQMQTRGPEELVMIVVLKNRL